MATEDHPFTEIVSKFKPNDWQLEKKEPIQPKSLDDAAVTIVDSEPLLYDLISKLKVAQEIAISIYFNKTSFRGAIALLVICTREEDFVVDPLNLKDQMTILNEIMMSTDILKVSFMNMGSKNEKRKMKLNILQRMQRDFGVYLVNVFDVGFASHALDIRGKLTQRVYLANSLKEYFGVEIDNEFNNERISAPVRPLSTEMIKYVREETHFLLSLYDVLRNKLIEREAPWYGEQLMDVYKQCAASAAVLYRASDYALKANAYKNHLWDDKFNYAQRECFRLIHNWRWKVAEESDQHLKEIMPTHHMKKIAQALPKTHEEIEACCEGSLSARAQSSIGEIKLFVHEALRKKTLDFPKKSEKSIKQPVSSIAAAKGTYKQPATTVNTVTEGAGRQPLSQQESKKNKDEYKQGTFNQPATTVNTVTEGAGRQRLFQQESKKNKDEYKQCYTCTKYGHVSKDCQNKVPWGRMGLASPMMHPMQGPMRGHLAGPTMRPTGGQIDLLMGALEGLIQNGQQNASRSGRFQPYNNQRGGR